MLFNTNVDLLKVGRLKASCQMKDYRIDIAKVNAFDMVEAKEGAKM